MERHFKVEYELLKTIPGVKENASVIIAEIGVNMDIFPTEMHLSSWAWMSPGNNESAGKKKPGATTPKLLYFNHPLLFHYLNFRLLVSQFF
ncbi:MAG: transposase [Syntrophales bacterium]